MSSSKLLLKNKSMQQLRRRKGPLRIIPSHINQISSSPIAPAPDSRIKEIYEKLDAAILESQVNEIQELGDELIAEGAYLKVINYFNQAATTFLRNGFFKEARTFTNKVMEIRHLILERDQKLNLLAKEKSANHLMNLPILYRAIIEISRKLNDLEGIQFYQSELTQLQTRIQADPSIEKTGSTGAMVKKMIIVQEMPRVLLRAPTFHEEFQTVAIRDLELKRNKLENHALTLENRGNFIEAANFYEQCEQICVQLIQLGKLDEKLNEEKFRINKMKCLDKHSKKYGGKAS